MAKLLIKAIIYSSLGTTLSAQAPSEQARLVRGEDLVKAFVSNCTMNPGRTDKVKAAAKAFGYQPLSGEAAVILSPQAGNAQFSGWAVTDGVGAPYLLGVSKGAIDGKEYEICAASNPYISVDKITNALRSILQLRVAASDEYESGQRYRTWNVSKIADGAQITLMDAQEMVGGGITLSLAAPTSN